MGIILIILIHEYHIVYLYTYTALPVTFNNIFNCKKVIKYGTGERRVPVTIKK